MPSDRHESAHVTPLEVLELTLDDVERLRLGFWSRLSESDVKRVVSQYPGLSIWVPDTLEYAIAGPWRHRREVVNVLALSAARHPAELLDSVARNCALSGARLLISIEIDEVRHPAFYAHAGFELLEEVIAYELIIPQTGVEQRERIRFERVDTEVTSELELLVRLDHATFPWLWRNSAEEFRTYGIDPGVELFVGYLAGEAVCYMGITAFLGWGHLDRIAVLPDRQGIGLGAEALEFVIRRLVATGAARIGLSTQLNNHRSQRLYERFGFRRGTQNDYRIYGRELMANNRVDRESGSENAVLESVATGERKR